MCIILCVGEGSGENSTTTIYAIDKMDITLLIYGAFPLSLIQVLLLFSYYITTSAYSLSDLECLPAERFCCLIVSTLPIEHREVVKCRCNCLVMGTQHSLSDLQGFMEDLGRLFQLALFPVAFMEIL